MREFREQAKELGMDALGEVHDEAELETALASGAEIVGVNSRNLHDFTVDLNTTFRLKRLMPTGVPLVSESGIMTSGDILRLKEAGVAAALVGESLMRAGREGTLLRVFAAV